MNKLACLPKKRTPTPGKGGALSGMDDLLLSGMADGLARIGALGTARSGHDWTSRSVQVIPGVTITARLPPTPVVEIDGMTLVTEMVKAADSIFPKVAQALQKERASGKPPNSNLPAHDLLGIVLGDGYSRSDIVVAVTRKLLVLQEWKWLPAYNRYQSPIWLYPSIMLKWETLEELVREEVKIMETGKLLTTKPAPDPEDDELLLPTEF